MGVNGGVRIIMQHILIEPLLVPSNDPMNRTSKTPPLRGHGCQGFESQFCHLPAAC